MMSNLSDTRYLVQNPNSHRPYVPTALVKHPEDVGGRTRIAEVPGDIRGGLVRRQVVELVGSFRGNDGYRWRGLATR